MRRQLWLIKIDELIAVLSKSVFIWQGKSWVWIFFIDWSGGRWNFLDNSIFLYNWGLWETVFCLLKKNHLSLSIKRRLRWRFSMHCFLKTLGKRYIKSCILFRFWILLSFLRRLLGLYYKWSLWRKMAWFIEKGRNIKFIPSFYIRSAHEACFHGLFIPF